MAMASPNNARITIARPSRANGVLSIPASATQKKSGLTHEAQLFRAAGARLKIVIRRLPPGLTQPEFEETLGEDWATAGDRVDWAVYKPGKVSKEYACHTADAFCYILQFTC